jgi:integrase
MELPRAKTEVERGCPLWAETAAALETWLQIRPQSLCDICFIRHDGKPYTPVNSEVAKQFRIMRDLAGIRRGGFSWLRKTFATYASILIKYGGSNRFRNNSQRALGQRISIRCG